MRIASSFLLLAAWFTQAQALPPDLTTTPIISTGSFSTPIGVQMPNDGTNRLFVFEKGTGCAGGNGTARIWIVKNGVKQATPFLTMNVSCNSEQGLLGLAFHPNYAANGYFYVAYTMPIPSGCSGVCLGSFPDQVVSRYHVSANPDIADAASKLDILHAPDLADNHNGGDIHFGPDGYLYWSIGDGGVQNDPNGFAQCSKRKLADNTPAKCGDLSAGGTPYYFLGKILRLDVDHTTAAAGNDMCGVAPGAAANYAVPNGNPLKGQATQCSEIWALGMRNPYRFTFDHDTGDMYVADVGQGTTEEIDFQAAASTTATPYNYGWNICEGNHTRGSTAAPAPNTACSSPSSVGYIPDILEYFHSVGSPTGCAVIGGYRFRGPIQQLKGVYLFSDNCNGGLFYGTQGAGGAWTRGYIDLPSGQPSGPTGFGEDVYGNVYVASGGMVYKFTSDYIFADRFGD